MSAVEFVQPFNFSGSRFSAAIRVIRHFNSCAPVPEARRRDIRLGLIRPPCAHEAQDVGIRIS